MSRMEVTELSELIRGIEAPNLAPVTEALLARLSAMDTIGLGHLNLARATGTLSGGESQRIKTVKHLGSSLTEMLYSFDEPTVGLHATDVESMTQLLEQLRDSGISILVGEHDPAVMARADQVIETGPAAGADGGRLIFSGTLPKLQAADTPTGRALSEHRLVKAVPRPSDIDTLLHVLDTLVDQGHTVVVIEHNLDVIEQADWLIDLGPGHGRHGGTILYQGLVGDYTDRETPRGTPWARANQAGWRTAKAVHRDNSRVLDHHECRDR